MSGYGTNTGEMIATASAIKGLAQPVRELKGKVAAPEATGKDFGEAHQAAGEPYRAGLEKLGQAVEAHAAAMENFAGRLEAVGSGYEWVESENTSTVRNSGGQ